MPYTSYTELLTAYKASSNKALFIKRLQVQLTWENFNSLRNQLINDSLG